MSATTIQKVSSEELRKEVENYFAQDLVTADVASFAIGQLWLYFYRETLVGVRNLETDEGYFLNAKTKLPDNGFSSQHLITEKIIEGAVNEGVSNTPVKYLEFEALADKALQMTLAEASNMAEKHLLAE